MNAFTYERYLQELDRLDLLERKIRESKSAYVQERLEKINAAKIRYDLALIEAGNYPSGP